MRSKKSERWKPGSLLRVSPDTIGGEAWIDDNKDVIGKVGSGDVVLLIGYHDTHISPNFVLLLTSGGICGVGWKGDYAPVEDGV